MFQWDKSINAINVPASKVVNLFRSMREVQLALPGNPAQQASAFICQYQVEGGVCTTAVFHLHKSKLLAFYCDDPRVVPEDETDDMLGQGLNLVESMGFLMTDQDIHLLDESDQEMLWEALPLKGGLSAEEEAAPAVAPAKKSEPKPVAKVEKPKAAEAPKEEPKEPVAAASSKPAINAPASAEPEKTTPKAESGAESADNVDDLLAAVEAMRAKRPGLRARKLPPSAEEMDRRRQQLRETVGRILASL